ncbi:MAG: TIGR03013 family PEP-CTERM/XrtA system glycosyltransferase [Geminicoccaceae bacterium]|nr:TIGR03013 family PEP-CTERM/XrtA system glycosyltransferase [Geminicoccaceae bacterium]
MLKIFGHYIDRRLAVLAAGDGLVLLTFFYIGYFTRYANPDSFASELLIYLPHAAIFAGTAMLCMVAIGLYERGIELTARSVTTRLAMAFTATFIMLAVISYVIPEAKIWRSALIIAIPGAFLAILALRLLLQSSPLGRSFERRILIVGEPRLMDHVGKIVADNRHSAIRVVDRLRVDSAIVRANDLTTLRRYAEDHDVSEIVVAVEDSQAPNVPIRPLLECRLAGLPLSDHVAFAERETGRVDLTQLQKSWLIFSDGFDSSRLDLVAKRILDVVISLFVLILCVPLMLMAAIAVKLEDGGPVIYSQTRVGRNGQLFMLHKFRSMRTDAEKLGAQWAAENDPRVTRTGRFLRATRIDELPQLWNVLHGEMSFVGPRPERPVFVTELERELPYFNERHRIKPGISGWAQVNHEYAATIEDTRVKLEYDMYYVKNWSLFLDFLIIAQTLRVVFTGNGAR